MTSLRAEKKKSNTDQFLAFLSSRRSDIRRIARTTRGDYTVEDISGEAWIAANKIERKRGFPADFSNNEDQELILAWLYNRFVQFAEKSVRFAARLDAPVSTDDSEGSASCLIDFLAASEQFDPLVQIQEMQEQLAPLELVKHSYSQLSAYAILLHRFDWDLEALAEQLRIVVDTVRDRLTACATHLKFQASLFDRIQTISLDFAPTIARSIIRKQFSDMPRQQLDFGFA